MVFTKKKQTACWLFVQDKSHDTNELFALSLWTPKILTVFTHFAPWRTNQYWIVKVVTSFRIQGQRRSKLDLWYHEDRVDDSHSFHPLCSLKDKSILDRKSCYISPKSRSSEVKTRLGQQHQPSEDIHLSLVPTQAIGPSISSPCYWIYCWAPLCRLPLPAPPLRSALQFLYDHCLCYLALQWLFKCSQNFKVDCFLSLNSCCPRVVFQEMFGKSN